MAEDRKGTHRQQSDTRRLGYHGRQRSEQRHAAVEVRREDAARGFVHDEVQQPADELEIAVLIENRIETNRPAFLVQLHSQDRAVAGESEERDQQAALKIGLGGKFVDAVGANRSERAAPRPAWSSLTMY